MEEEDADLGQPAKTEIPPNGSGAQTHIWGTTTASAATGTKATGVPTPPALTHLRFGTSEPPTLPIRDGEGTNPGNNSVELQNKFAPLKQ